MMNPIPDEAPRDGNPLRALGARNIIEATVSVMISYPMETKSLEVVVHVGEGSTDEQFKQALEKAIARSIDKNRDHLISKRFIE